jgi:hypothetical protein
MSKCICRDRHNAPLPLAPVVDFDAALGVLGVFEVFVVAMVSSLTNRRLARNVQV